MKKLLHYEFRKSLGTKLILLGIVTVVELAFLISLLADSEDVISISVVLLVMLAFFGAFFIGIQSIVILHRDMNTRQGYMLFMTPNSCYRILGAKVLENGISLLLTGAFFALLGFLDVTLLLSHYGQLDQLWKMFNQIITNAYPSFQMHWDTILSFFFAFLCSWLATVVTAFLADAVATALLKGKKAGPFLAFLLFILLQLAVYAIQRRIHINGGFTVLMLVEAGLDLAFATLMYWGTAVLMERKLSI